jgi:hypothetical protein
MRLKDKIGIVTAAGSGMGRAGPFITGAALPVDGGTTALSGRR